MLCRVKDLIFESNFFCKGSFCSIISCKSCRSSAFFKSIIQVPFRAASQVCPSSQTNMSLTSTKEVLMRDIQGIILVPFSNGFPKGTPSFFVWIFLCVFLPLSVWTHFLSPSPIGLRECIVALLVQSARAALRRLVPCPLQPVPSGLQKMHANPIDRRWTQKAHS